jgi:hypothetical protein
VVWADANAAGAVIETLARAAGQVQAAGVTGEDAEADAREFLAWAATTPRSWLVVLDDITDPAQVAQWWPASHMPATADADGYGRTVAATLLLALDAADARDLAGLARPAIRLAAVLDPAGHPAALWATGAATEFLMHNRSGQARPAGPSPSPDPGAEPVTSTEARDAILLLHRYSLATFDDQAGPRAMRVHALTARAAREITAAAQAPAIAFAAADALMAIWPDPDHIHPALADALRASALSLASHAGDMLWHPDGHPVLYKTAASLLNAGLHTAAITYCLRAAADAARILGPEHPGTLTAQANLIVSYWQAGRTA